jgi:hypothetical protein
LHRAKPETQKKLQESILLFLTILNNILSFYLLRALRLSVCKIEIHTNYLEAFKIFCGSAALREIAFLVAFLASFAPLRDALCPCLA